MRSCVWHLQFVAHYNLEVGVVAVVLLVVAAVPLVEEEDEEEEEEGKESIETPRLSSVRSSGSALHVSHKFSTFARTEEEGEEEEEEEGGMRTMAKIAS